jgi:hypothetical protein
MNSLLNVMFFYENIKKIVFSSIGLKGGFRVRKLINFLDKKKAKRHGRAVIM